MQVHNEYFVANHPNSGMASEEQIGSAHTIKYGRGNYAESAEGYKQSGKNGDSN